MTPERIFLAAFFLGGLPWRFFPCLFLGGLSSAFAQYISCFPGPSSRLSPLRKATAFSTGLRGRTLPLETLRILSPRAAPAPLSSTAPPFLSAIFDCLASLPVPPPASVRDHCTWTGQRPLADGSFAAALEHRSSSLSLLELPPFLCVQFCQSSSLPPLHLRFACSLPAALIAQSRARPSVAAPLASASTCPSFHPRGAKLKAFPTPLLYRCGSHSLGRLLFEPLGAATRAPPFSLATPLRCVSLPTRPLYPTGSRAVPRSLARSLAGPERRASW